METYHVTYWDPKLEALRATAVSGESMVDAGDRFMTHRQDITEVYVSRGGIALVTQSLINHRKGQEKGA